MGNYVFSFILIPVAALFTGIGIYAWKREKPMWFWSGSTVSEEEISDVPAYNRANGIMWLVFAALFWTSTVLGFLNMKASGICLIAGCVIGIPALPIVYGRIYNKYKTGR